MADNTDDKDIKDIVKDVADKTEKKAGEEKVVAEVCPKCGSPLSEITMTATGRKLQRCSAGSWDPTTRQNLGCDYVKWLEIEPEQLDEKCPKCGSPLVLSVTRFGKKMKKCS